MIDCNSCTASNPDESKFCGQCGSPIEIACYKCGSLNPSTHRFCGQCSAPLQPVTAERMQPQIKPERRQLTVMFCDLVGSTQLSEQLDPEDLREVIRAYHATAGEIIRSFGGHVAQHLGDGLLVYFGFPKAHEDDARRGILAALGIFEEMQGLNQSLKGRLDSELRLRIGIHTGAVVIGEVGAGGSREALALGSTPNVAARLQGYAGVDELVVSEETYRLTRRFFDFRELGAQRFKGISKLVKVYQVLQARSGNGGLPYRSEGGLFGREKEEAELACGWEEVMDGGSPTYLVSAEAGVGKTALVATLSRKLASEEGRTLLVCQCSPYHQGSAFYPLAQQVEELLDSAEPEARARELNHLLEAKGFDKADTPRLLGSILGLPVPEEISPQQGPEQQRERIFEIFMHLFFVASRGLFIVEDLQWADPSTLDFLGRAAKLRPKGWLFILTSREGFEPKWEGADLRTMRLSRLDRQAVEAIIRHQAREKQLAPELVDHLVLRTDGIPLFVEELTKMVLESSLLEEKDHRLELKLSRERLRIPATLQASLNARLDQLGEAKEIAQAGATIGRTFTFRVLQSILDWPEERLREGMQNLLDSELIYRQYDGTEEGFLFKHALIQDAAYRSMLRSARRGIHRRIAEVLAGETEASLQHQPELIAEHFTQAQEWDSAANYWQKAGDLAIERGANIEAVNHLSRGLETLEEIDENEDRIASKLTLQVTLGGPLMAVKGYASQEVADAYSRARDLCEKVGETPQLFSVMMGLWAYYFVGAELRTALSLAERCLMIGEQLSDQSLQSQAHYAIGMPRFQLGHFSKAQEHFEKAIQLYVDGNRQLGWQAVVDPKALSLTWSSWAEWLCGGSEKALCRGKASVQWACDLEHPYTMAWAWNGFSRLSQFRSLHEDSGRQAQTALTIASEGDFPLWVGVAQILKGKALADQGDREQGREVLSKGMETWHSTGAALWRPYWLVLMAEIDLEDGRFGEAMESCKEALELVESTDESWIEAEVHRVLGRAQMATGFQEQAEASFNRAIEVSSLQKAVFFRLKATLDQFALLSEQGRELEHAAQLVEICGLFPTSASFPEISKARVLKNKVLGPQLSKKGIFTESTI